MGIRQRVRKWRRAFRRKQSSNGSYWKVAHWGWIRNIGWRRWRKFKTTDRWKPTWNEKIRNRKDKPLPNLGDDTVHSVPKDYAELWAAWPRNRPHCPPKHPWEAPSGGSSRSKWVLGEWATSSCRAEWDLHTPQTRWVWPAPSHPLQHEGNKVRKSAYSEERLNLGGRRRAPVHDLSGCLPNRRPCDHSALPRCVPSWVYLELACKQK